MSSKGFIDVFMTAETNLGDNFPGGSMHLSGLIEI